MYSFFNLGATLDGSGQRHAPPFDPREGEPVPIAQEAGWAPEPVWTDAKNLVITVILSPDLPARSEWL